MGEEKLELPERKLDMLILKIVALGPIHSYKATPALQAPAKRRLGVKHALVSTTISESAN